MSLSLASYIALPGTTADAMQHWHDTLGGDLQLLRYGDMQLEGLPFEPDPDAVAHAMLTFPGGSIAGSDVMDDAVYPIRDTAYSLLVTTETHDEAHRIFDGFLNGGGSVAMPLEIAPWGDLYGQVFDRFGVMWAVSCEASGDHS